MAQKKPYRMNTQEAEIYQRMLFKAREGKLSEEDIHALNERFRHGSTADMRRFFRVTYDLGLANKIVQLRREYVHKYVTPNFDRVPSKLWKNLDRALISREEYYRVVDVSTLNMCPDALKPLDMYRPDIGDSNIVLPWLVGRDSNSEVLDFLCQKHASEAILWLDVPTPILSVDAKVIRPAYAYFFDKKE